eukprot:2736264-Pyramimonas_sp.AAC.1
MRRASTLVFRSDCVLHDPEPAMAEVVAQESPDRQHQQVHVNADAVGAADQVLSIRPQPIRHWELPFGRGDRNEQIWESRHPFLVPGSVPAVIVEFLVALLVVALPHLNAHEIRERVADNIPIASARLRSPHHNVGGDVPLLRKGVRCEELAGHLHLEHEKDEIWILGVCANLAQSLAVERIPAGNCAILLIIVELSEKPGNAGVREVRGGVEPGPSRALDALECHEEVKCADVLAVLIRIRVRAVGRVQEGLVKAIVFDQPAKSRLATSCGKAAL